MDKDFVVPAVGCPVCGKQLDRARAISTRGPKPGDLSLCIYCTAVLRFNNDLTLRECTDEEFKGFPEDQQKFLEDVCSKLRSIHKEMNFPFDRR